MSAHRAPLLALSVPLVGVVLVGTLGARVREGRDETLRHLRVFSEALRLASTNYVDDVGAGTLERGACQGLAESLGPWSSYHDPEHMAPLLRRDRGGDVGVLLLKWPQRLVAIAAVVPGGPADLAGLERLELMETIDGVATRGLTLAEARAMLLGPVGSTVEVGLFERDEAGKPRVVSLVRQDLGALRVVVERVDEHASILRLTDVRAGAAELVAQALQQVRAAGDASLVLDLRNVVGGDAQEAGRVARLFTGAGPLFALRSRSGTTVETSAEPAAWTGGLVAMIGRGTVGEGELVAEALRARGAASLVGDSTFGKRSREELVRLSDGSGLELPTGEYRRADGEPLPAEGITPDEKVARRAATDLEEPGSTDEALERTGGPDEELPAAGAAPAGGRGTALPPRDGDRELQRALELLAAAPARKAA